MVGDLREKLEPIGKLDVLDGVGSRVLAYYSKQDAGELSDDALLQRSRALNLMAQVAYDRGRLDQAERLYQQAVAGTAEVVRRSAADPKRLFEHAQNVFWVGEIAREAGRPNQSEAAYREYKRIADQMASLEPDNLKYRMEVLYANEDVGISLFDQHRFAEASRQFEGVAGPMEKLASLYPANTIYQKEFANDLAWIADAQRAQGKLNAAAATRQRQIAVLDQLLATAADSDVRSKLIDAHRGLGVVLAEKGRSDQALQEMRAAVDEAERLIPIEPRNAEWKSLAAGARLQLATTLLSLGRRDEAAQHAAAGCTLEGALPASFAISAKARLRTTCAMTQSRLELTTGANAQALGFAQRALASARSEHSENPISDRYWVANAYRLIGDVHQRRGDADDAKAAWNTALGQLPANVAERPWQMNLRMDLLRRLQRSREAAALAAKLTSIGYRPLE
jgi:tetratricopeptide (TPR) repeat protein